MVGDEINMSFICEQFFLYSIKFRIPETQNFSMCADRRTNTKNTKFVLIFAILTIRSLIRSLQVSWFWSPTEGKTYPHIH